MFNISSSRRNWFRMLAGAVLGTFVGRTMKRKSQPPEIPRKHVDPKCTVFHYDSAGTKHPQTVTTFTYDSGGRLRSVTDPGGNVTTYTLTYDSRGRSLPPDGQREDTSS